MRKALGPLLLAALCLASEPLDRATDLLRKGDFPAALKAAEEVPPRDDGYARACYLIGEIHLLLGDADAAADAFDAGRKAKPDAEPLLTGLGRARIAQQRPADARPLLEKALAKNPKSGRAACFLGIAKLNDSGGRKGRKEIAKGLKLAPKDPEVARAAVLAYLQWESVDAAAKAARRFSKARRDHPMGPFLAALAYERDKKFDEAIDAYEKSLALDEHFLDAHKNLAILCIAQNPMYRNRKRTEKALKHFERYFALGGSDPEVKRVYGTLQQFLKSR